jgi:hypothetical protein
VNYYQLSVDSPCIDAGTADTLGLFLPNVDLAGCQRVWNDIVDMGVFEYGAPVHNEDESNQVLPTQFAHTVYPNPVFLNSGQGSVATFEFVLPNKQIKEPVIEIYNIRGQRVRTIRINRSFSDLVRKAGLSTEEKQNGEFYFQLWDCRDDRKKPVSSGVYFYMIKTENSSVNGKLVIIK